MQINIGLFVPSVFVHGQVFMFYQLTWSDLDAVCMKDILTTQLN